MTVAADQPEQKTETLDVPADSRLFQLLEQYAQVLPQYEELASQVADLKTAIKSEMNTQAPEATTVFAASARYAAKLTWKVQRRFNVTKFKTDQPETYEQYREAKGQWELRAQ